MSLQWDIVLSPLFHIKRTRKFTVIDLVARHDVTAVRPADHSVIVNVNCPYTEECVVNALARRPWCHRITGTGSIPAIGRSISTVVIQIADFENIVWEPVMSGEVVASSYLVRKGLSRKAQLALQIKRYLSKHPTSILKAAVPSSLVIETWNAFDDMKLDMGRGLFASLDAHSAMRMPLRQRLEWCLEDAKDYVCDPERDSWYWILKPSVTNKGTNIVVAKEWDEIVDAIEDESDIREWVLQRYVDNPLLLHEYKFHLRVYILCIGALEVFVFDRILMLLAGRKYNLCDLEDIHNHLTNTARAIELEDFDETLFVKVLDDLPRLLTELYPTRVPTFDSAKEIKQRILDQVHTITGELFKAFENEYTVFSPMSNCFELFGLDFLVDNDFNVSLLEVNPGPDFKQTGDRLRSVIVELWEQTVSLVVDGNVFQQSPEANGSSAAYVRAPDFTKVYSKEWSASQFKGGMGFS